MTVDWTDEPASIRVADVPWLVSKISNWRRSLTQRANALDPRQPSDLAELRELTVAYTTLVGLDYTMRERHSLPDSEEYPAWVVRHLGSRG